MEVEVEVKMFEIAEAIATQLHSISSQIHLTTVGLYNLTLFWTHETGEDCIRM